MIDDDNMSIRRKEVDTMTKITVARALTKLKALQKKMSNLVLDIEKYGGINSMQLSPLSMSKDIETNHKEAEAVIAAKIASYNDSLKYYTDLYTKIQEANNKNTIHTERYGEITVAKALVLTGRLYDTVKNFSVAVGSAAATAERSANQFNGNLSSGGFTALGAGNVPEAFLAQPYVLIPITEVERARDFYDEIQEINDLINECNALSTIEIDD